ncbi:MAG: hypothetical protein JNL87_02285 [Burkholderiaceae bacterium]|nr:hypothetical protein [Burkholderiaceae bacterium]
MRRRDLAATLLALAPAALPWPAARAAGADRGADTWFVFLETGRPTPDDPPAVQAMQRGHIENFKRLFAAGQLQAAGPLLDPARTKRGIVVVRAASHDELIGYFQPDAYVREGYMRVNAVRALPRQPLNTEGIDDTRIEEVRIVLIARPAAPAGADTAGARQRLLQTLVDRGTIGAWYTLADGPLAEVLFARGTDSAGLEAALAPYPGLAGGDVGLAIWRQWISPGVVGPR